MLLQVKNKEIFASLDIGTSKIVCIIAIIENFDLRIIGYSQKAALGLSGSNITDIITVADTTTRQARGTLPRQDQAQSSTSAPQTRRHGRRRP